LTANHRVAWIDKCTQCQRTTINNAGNGWDALLEFALTAIHVAFEQEGTLTGMSEHLLRLIAFVFISLDTVRLFAYPVIRDLITISIGFEAGVGQQLNGCAILRVSGFKRQRERILLLCLHQTQQRETGGQYEEEKNRPAK